MRSPLTVSSGIVMLLGLQVSPHPRRPEIVAQPWMELRLTVDHRAIPGLRFDVEPRELECRMTLRNRGLIPLRLLTPQDGSESGWRNPSILWYRADGTLVRPAPRCGNMNGIDESGYFTLAPGESREIDVDMPVENGENRLRVVYDISADRDHYDPYTFIFPKGSRSQRPKTDATGLDALTPIRVTSNIVSVSVGTRPLASDSPSRR